MRRGITLVVTADLLSSQLLPAVAGPGETRHDWAAATDFDEVWHLVKPDDDSRPWAIAGIEQRH